MSTETEIYTVLSEIFRDVFMRDIVINPELSAKDVDGWDSLKQIEILVEVQERLNLKLSTREVDQLNTVGDLLRVLIAKSSAAK
jgi:acyl carrier protein